MAKEKRGFDQEAASWDEQPTRVRLARDIVTAIIHTKILRPDMAALDFGCGTGLVTLGLAPLLGSITGADSSRGMLEVLAAKIAQLGLTKVHTQFCDLDQGGSLSGRYGLVVSSMTLHHIAEIAPLLARFYALLDPGGVLCLADLDLDGGQFHSDSTGVFHPGFDRGELLQALTTAGFVDGAAVTAAEIEKTGSNGVGRCFTVFLITARKPRL